MRTHSMKLIGSMLAFSLLVAPASARNSLRVSHGDLDLNRAADAATMAARLDAAAREICGQPQAVTGSRILRRPARAAFESCRQAAVNEALAKLDEPLVERAYAQAGARAG